MRKHDYTEDKSLNRNYNVNHTSQNKRGTNNVKKTLVITNFYVITNSVVKNIEG